MPPKKGKKKNNFEEDYFFEDAEATAPGAAANQLNEKGDPTVTNGSKNEDGDSNMSESTQPSKSASKKAAKGGKKKAKFEDFDDYFFGDDDADEAKENRDETANADEVNKEAKSQKSSSPPEEPKEAESINLEDEFESKGPPKKANKADKKKKNKKGQQDDFFWENEEAEAPPAEEAASGENISKPNKKANEKPKPGEKVKPVGDSDDNDDGDESSTFKKKDAKSTAEKKAEKKKRDAEKRRLERQKEEERLQKLADQQAKQEEKEKAKRAAAEEAEQSAATTAVDPAVGAVPTEPGDEEGPGKGAAGKQGKKKEKGGKGGLGAAAKKALQEELDRKKAEEERIRKEEEEKLRIAEEMKRQQEEKERLEKERKEKKKQRKKEEIAKQKADGTYLTKSQKEEKARLEAARQMFLQSGNVKIAALEKQQETADGKENNNNNKNRQNNQFLAQKKKPGKGQKEKEDKLIEEQKAAEELKLKEIEEAKKKEPEVVDNWEDQSEDEDWEKMDEKDGDDISEKGSDELSSKQSQQDKVEALTNGLKAVKLENGQVPSKEEPVEDSESSDDESSSEEDEVGTFTHEEIRERIEKRKKESEANRDVGNPRCAVVCVLGHVDTGKTKILDKIRRTNVQDGEAGGITQQIGATNMPQFAITEWSKSANVKGFDESTLKLPGFLVIDTPGHESFTNLRTRGSSLCDLAILVVDIMHGLEPQTLESIQLLKNRQAPFVIALNKIDRLFEWKSNPNQDIRDTIKRQKKHTKDEFETRLKQVIAEFAEKCELNVVPFWENEDPATYVSICPTSAHTGDGMGNMIWYMVTFCQSFLKKRLAYRTEPQATVLEVKEIQGLGTTIDVILVNGRLKEGVPIVVAGYEGPIQTYVKALLVPPAMKELRVKNQYDKVKQVRAATGVKILAKDVEKALAGMPMLVAARTDEQELLTEEMEKILASMISSIKLNDRGVYVQASTLGSLEALLEFLKQSQIPYSGINIGPVHKKDVMKATTMLEHNELYGVILAFDVKVERDAQEMANTSGIRIFTADIIYHLFDKFQAYKDELKQKAKDKHRHLAIFPCKLRVLPNCIFNTRDPIIIGVTVEAGIVKAGTQICVPSKEGIILGTVASLEMNNRTVDSARQGSDVCLKIENTTGEAPKLYGRHFDSTDLLMSKLSRESIDALKDHFRDEMTKNDWLLVKELKAVFRIV